jgi:hypothetical protein
MLSAYKGNNRPLQLIKKEGQWDWYISDFRLIMTLDSGMGDLLVGCPEVVNFRPNHRSRKNPNRENNIFPNSDVHSPSATMPRCRRL